VITEKGFGRVAAPFGAPGSRGEFEAPAYAPNGLGESMAILEKTLIPSLIGMDATEQEKIDDLLKQVDGTPNFERMAKLNELIRIEQDFEKAHLIKW